MKNKVIFFRSFIKNSLKTNKFYFISSKFYYFFFQKREKNQVVKLYRNFFYGLQSFFFVELFLKGLGYKIVLLDDFSILIDIGLSHFIKISSIPDVFFKIKKNNFIIYSFNKQKLMEVANYIIKFKESDVYKGKGFNFVYNSLKLKVGKKR